ncbi:hypothetical protein [Polyangium sp. y55x31]|uniref:hypothetical protein n=1 Tax=Polyangium sp. y55x31 TaxID=3042688 RepID=UPI0024829C8E|nr:hypothetical protein [Polyangium sp. y55x31]MDI1484560.1 hypothetical protein [Polyangium sp. y55x31]
MDAPFPFGFPGPTAFYLATYVLTLVAHVVFMNYVLAGTGVLLVRQIRGKSGTSDVLAELLRDWLPFALSAAITAGIAPLLFIQILYKKAFYTANLLLFHRWMLILPALIVGFYLLYAQKTAFVKARPRLKVLVTTGALACFLFTALSWTENYLLARSEGAWAPMYASKSMIYENREILPRMLLWTLGALPTLAVLLGWQLHRRERAGSPVETATFQRVARLGLGGLVVAGACAAGYAMLVGPAARAHAVGPMALPWFVAAAAGVVVEGAGFVGLYRAQANRGKWLGIASAGLFFVILGTTVVREVLRITAVDFAALYPEHARAAQVSGRWLFLGFFLVNAVLATWAIRTALTRAERPAA